MGRSLVWNKPLHFCSYRCHKQLHACLWIRLGSTKLSCKGLSTVNSWGGCMRCLECFPPRCGMGNSEWWAGRGSVKKYGWSKACGNRWGILSVIGVTWISLYKTSAVHLSSTDPLFGRIYKELLQKVHSLWWRVRNNFLQRNRWVFFKCDLIVVW